jgi:tetratricopeptide (TPR) repeat protein
MSPRVRITRFAFVLALATIAGPSRAANPAIEETGAAAANQAAWQAFQRRDFTSSERLAREAWKAAEAGGDSLQAAFAAANTAAAVAMRGRLDEGLEWSRRAEERLGPGREPLVRGRILVAQAILQQVRGEGEASATAFARAREALGSSDWSLSFADAMVKAYDWEDMNAAFQSLTALRDAAEGAREPRRQATALLALGWLDGVGGSPEAEKTFGQARAILVSRNEKAALPLIDHNLGSVLLWADRLDEALKVYERGLAAARAEGDRRLEVILLDDLSLVFSQKEDWPRAIASDREAGARLAAIAEDVRAGRLEDSLLLDLRRLFKARYVHKPQLLIDLFPGLLDQLAVEPKPSGSGS